MLKKEAHILTASSHDHCHHVHCNGKAFHKIATEMLKSTHFKITKPRLAVIDCLENAEVALSPKEIFAIIKENKELKIDLVSVYRVLESLTKLGLVHQIFPSGNYVCCKTSCETEPSHILVNCMQCNKTSEVHLEWDFIEKIYNKIRKNSHFKPIKHTMQINGLCAKCDSLQLSKDKN